jgi:hypothetical protein
VYTNGIEYHTGVQKGDKEKLKKIRIFAAAPQDVRREYACLESLVQQLNKPGEIAGQMGITLELISRGYHSDSLPGKGEPGNGPGLSGYDLFIGILWARFDSPREKKAGKEQQCSPPLRKKNLIMFMSYGKQKRTPVFASTIVFALYFPKILTQVNWRGCDYFSIK